MKKGEINPDMQKMLKRGIIAAILAALGIIGFAALSFFAAPFVLTVIATALFTGSMVYMFGIGYGILNDIFACRKNLPYFTLGHQNWQKGLIKSNKIGAQAVAWGILATADLSLIAAAVFTVATLVAGFFVPIALFILPVMALVIPLMVLGANYYANKKEKAMLAEDLGYADYDWESFRLNSYQIERLNEMCPTREDKAAWFANGARNGFGYKTVPLFGVVGLASVITLSAVSPFLPAILFGAVASAFVPAALGLVVVAAIATALIYLAVNHDKQINNKYALQYGENELEFDSKGEEVKHPMSNLLSHSNGKKADKKPVEVPHHRSPLDSTARTAGTGLIITQNDQQELVL